MLKLFVIPDLDGNIVKSLAGENLVPNVSFGLLFEVDSWDIPMNIQDYRVENEKLVRK